MKATHPTDPVGLWKRRMALNLSPSELAAKADVSEDLIDLVERGGKAKTGALERIEAALGTLEAGAIGASTDTAESTSSDAGEDPGNQDVSTERAAEDWGSEDPNTEDAAEDPSAEDAADDPGSEDPGTEGAAEELGTEGAAEELGTEGAAVESAAAVEGPPTARKKRGCRGPRTTKKYPKNEHA